MIEDPIYALGVVYVMELTVATTDTCCRAEGCLTEYRQGCGLGAGEGGALVLARSSRSCRPWASCSSH